jgi:hypothetical protein
MKALRMEGAMQYIRGVATPAHDLDGAVKGMFSERQQAHRKDVEQHAS